jgi:predicted transcriptional regulator of viral defense system
MEIFHSIDMPGKWFTELFDIAVEQHGYVTPANVREIGGTPQVLADLHRYHHVERVGHGVYRFTSLPIDRLGELMEATLWPRELGVISHDSALDLWDLCDVNPAKIHVTIPNAARIRRFVPSRYVVHQRILYRADITKFEGVAVVTPERAILDGIERHLDNRLIDQAIDTARARGLLKANELKRIACIDQA